MPFRMTVSHRQINHKSFQLSLPALKKTICNHQTNYTDGLVYKY